MEPIWVLGLMSGTSLDGVDGALSLTDGEAIAAFGPSDYRPYSAVERGVLRAALAEAPAAFRGASLGSVDWTASPALSRASDIVTTAHIEICRTLFDKAAARPALIGFHGQTIWHDPANRVTVQIGDPQALAKALGCDVVGDFRSADVAAGGQGAPFAPFYHFALAKSFGASEPLVFLNLGGVGNATWVDPTTRAPDAPGALLAFDTGPANALIDDWMAARAGAAYDQNGATAARGRVDEAALRRLLQHPYFAAPPPKSLDRNAFAAGVEALSNFSIEDGAATLTAFTAQSVALAARHFAKPPARWLVCGGGRRNPMLMRWLADHLTGDVQPIEAAGVHNDVIDGDMIEANAFAYLAARALGGKPLSAPGTTGVPTPTLGGRLFRA